MTRNHHDPAEPLNLGDPVLEAKLSRAMPPEPTPWGLEEGILQATLPLLNRPSDSLSPSWRLRLVGQAAQVPRWVRSAAASLVIAASLGIVLTTGSILQSAHTQVTLNTLDRDLAFAVAPVTQTSAVRWQAKQSTAVSRIPGSSDIQSMSQDLDLAIESLDQALSQPNTQLNQTPCRPSSSDGRSA